MGGGFKMGETEVEVEASVYSLPVAACVLARDSPASAGRSNPHEFKQRSSEDLSIVFPITITCTITEK